MVSNVVWLEKRIRYIEGLKSLTENQQVLMELAGKTERSSIEEKQFKAAMKLEKLVEATAKAKSESAMLKSSAKKAERKARDHELYKSAGILLIGSGLVDAKTGKIIGDVEERLGSLIALNQSTPDDKRREQWKQIGAEKLNQTKPG